MKKQIAVIGSSGGNLYNQGGSNVDALMKEIFTQADRLVEMGLNIPQVTQEFLRLRKMGLPVENVYTLEQAVEALKALKGGCAHA